MPVGPTLRRADDSSLTDSTHSSSGSAERYGLNEDDERPILVYNYHGALETSSQRDLCARLDKSGRERVTRKHIPWATTYLDIKRHELFLPEEKRIYADKPNYYSSLASIKLPALPFWSRLFLGNYDELYIVSPESSPASSLADSMESRRISPTSTWGAGDEVSAGNSPTPNLDRPAAQDES